ncbi:MAG: PilZ domain-containing protein [Silvanigrellales bacterium]|nr:PilZ domain-containing protein [Silvanigrellales bacterium]
MSFLTLHWLSIFRAAHRLLIAAQLFLVCPNSALAQAGLGEGFSLQARGGGSPGAGTLAGGALSWVVGVVCVALIGVLVVTLWPNDSDENPYQRQRKFARVDGLFLKVTGYLLSDDESRIFLSSLRTSGAYATPSTLSAEGLTILSLSFGGCSIASSAAFGKGNIILLRLHSLPDFPSRDLMLAAKIVWIKARSSTGEPYDVCGAKFLFPSDRAGTESLRQYLNFLMDEPLS